MKPSDMAEVASSNVWSGDKETMHEPCHCWTPDIAQSKQTSPQKSSWNTCPVIIMTSINDQLKNMKM